MLIGNIQTQSGQKWQQQSRGSKLLVTLRKWCLPYLFCSDKHLEVKTQLLHKTELTHCPHSCFSEVMTTFCMYQGWET